MDTLVEIHSFVRWLIVIVAVIASAKFTLGWLRGGSFKKVDRILASAFSGLMDLQALLGLILLLWAGLARGLGFPMVRIGHAFIMLAAVIVGHAPARWKKSADQTRFRNTLFAILFALLLVYIGVAQIGGD